MSYTNGIGNPQQLPSAAEAVASLPAARVTKPEVGSVSASSAVLGNAPPVDKANVSTTAEMMAQALSGSDVRADKVAALQQTIAAGTYNVPSSNVADKLMSSMLR